MFLWGPPCPPFSVLNRKRKYGNPFDSPEGSVFLVGARYIRSFAAHRCIPQTSWMDIKSHYSHHYTTLSPTTS